MPGPEFFQTRMGQAFYERDVPNIVKALERIANALEEQNKPVTKVEEEVKGYQHLIIQTTENIAEAIRILDGIKPCVVFIKEMEKEGIPISSMIDEYTLQRDLETEISYLELSVRTRNCLKRADITTVSQLMSVSERDLLKKRSVGRKSLNEIKKCLADMGLSLKGA
jgi:DNA-directed RNA polymerase alpha subunit